MMEKFTKKNGEINISSLSLYLGYKTEAAMRKIKQTNPERFETLYLGALCTANSIDANELAKYCTNKKTKGE